MFIQPPFSGAYAPIPDPSLCIGLFDDDFPPFVLTSCAETRLDFTDFTLVAGSGVPGVISHNSRGDDGELRGKECVSVSGTIGELPGGTGCDPDAPAAQDGQLWTYYTGNRTVESALGGCWTAASDNSVSLFALLL